MSTFTYIVRHDKKQMLNVGKCLVPYIWEEIGKDIWTQDKEFLYEYLLEHWADDESEDQKRITRAIVERLWDFIEGPVKDLDNIEVTNDTFDRYYELKYGPDWDDGRTRPELVQDYEELGCVTRQGFTVEEMEKYKVKDLLKTW